MKSCPIATQGRDVQKTHCNKNNAKKGDTTQRKREPTNTTTRRTTAPWHPSWGQGMPSPWPRGPRKPHAVAKMPAVGAARSRTEARKLKKPRSETLVNCSGSRELTHRSEEAEEAAFRNHRDCSGSRELTGKQQRQRPRRARAHEQQPGSHRNAWGRPGASNDPATRSSPVRLGASRSHSPRTMPSICIPPRAPGGLPSRYTVHTASRGHHWRYHSLAQPQ